MYWAKIPLTVGDTGYTKGWRVIFGMKATYTFLQATHYQGAAIRGDDTITELMVTLWHEVQGHNIDWATHDTPEEEAAFNRKYEDPIRAAIAAAKGNGEWERIKKCCGIGPGNAK